MRQMKMHIKMVIFMLWTCVLIYHKVSTKVSEAGHNTIWSCFHQNKRPMLLYHHFYLVTIPIDLMQTNHFWMPLKLLQLHLYKYLCANANIPWWSCKIFHPLTGRWHPQAPLIRHQTYHPIHPVKSSTCCSTLAMLLPVDKYSNQHPFMLNFNQIKIKCSIEEKPCHIDQWEQTVMI